MLINKIEDLMNNTPLYKLSKVVDEKHASIYVKLENHNLTGSVKIRAAYQMIKDAQESGLLKEGMTLVEPTSGNTGIALAYIANLLGYKMVLVMPETMSVERRNIMSSYNAQVVLSEGTKGMNGAIAKANELVEQENYVMLQQFNNHSNAKAHYLTTGPEILNDVKQVDVFIVGVGTGGSITGVGRYLKENIDNVSIIAIEPLQSAVLSDNTPGPHKIQGIGAGFVPEILDTKIYDKIIKIDQEQAISFAKELYLKEGLFLGISSAANILGAIEVSKTLDKDKNIVTIAPDGGDRYLSNNVFDF